MSNWKDFDNGVRGLETPDGWVFVSEKGGMTSVSDGSKRMKTLIVGSDAPVPPVPATPTPTAPAPIPVVPLKPSVILNMIQEAGVWISTPDWTTKRPLIAGLQYNIADTAYGQNFDVSFSRRAKYPWEGNWKIFRVWSAQYPNWYVALGADGSGMIYTEQLEGITRKKDAAGVYQPWTRAYFKLPAPTGEWRPERYTWKANSGLGKADGWIKITLGGQVIFEADKWITDGAGSPGVPNRISIQDNHSNTNPPTAGAFTSLKDIEIKSWR